MEAFPKHLCSQNEMTKYPYPPLVLEPEQYETLRPLATQKHQTLSEVAVEVVRRGIRNPETKKRYNLW